MSLDPAANFAKSRVSQGYDASATSVTLESSDINLTQWPDPATYGAYNAVWWNATTYPDPADDPYREIVRVTAKNSATLTVARAQESTTATTKNTSGSTYKMAIVPTKKLVDDINTAMTDTGSVYGWVTDSPYNAAGDGVTDDSSAFDAAVAALTHIVVPSGTYVLDDDVTVGTGITLEILQGATLAPTAGKTITINGPVIAGDYDWQSGAGTVTLGTRTGWQSDRWDGTAASTLVAPVDVTVNGTLTATDINVTDDLDVDDDLNVDGDAVIDGTCSVSGWTLVPVKYYTSAEFAGDSAGVVDVDIAHGESFTPSIEDVVSMVAWVSSGYNESDPPYLRYPTLHTIDATNINVKCYLTDAGAANTKFKICVGMKQ